MQQNGDIRKTHYNTDLYENSSFSVSCWLLVLIELRLKRSPVKSTKNREITELLCMRCWHGSARIQKRPHPGDTGSGTETSRKPADVSRNPHVLFLWCSWSNPVNCMSNDWKSDTLKRVYFPEDSSGDISGLQICNPNPRCPFNRKKQGFFCKTSGESLVHMLN